MMNGGDGRKMDVLLVGCMNLFSVCEDGFWYDDVERERLLPTRSVPWQ